MEVVFIARLTCLLRRMLRGEKSSLAAFAIALTFMGQVNTAHSEDLSARYHDAVHQAYSSAAAHGRWPKANAFEHLLRLAAEHPAEELPGLILANIALALDNVDQPEMQMLVRRLLAQDALLIARDIRQAAIELGDRYLTSKLNYEFARYYITKEEWELCSKQLDQGILLNALSNEEKHYAAIMRGMLMQERAEHREAIPFYTSVDSTSDHYAVAQLNLATVYIRQGWWTDAHHAIKTALAVTDDLALQDRLHTTLGYSQLQNEFYRDARASFRRVRTNSPFTSRALFGLGIAALHQEDYAAAINAFKILKNSDTQNQSVVEAYLMLPITLEKIGQTGSAAAAYNEAIAYYERLVLQMERDLNLLRNSEKGSDLATANTALFNTVNAEPITRAVDKLRAASQLPLPPVLQHQLGQLAAEFEKLHASILTRTHEDSIDAIQHYLNQARFGVTRLHDSKNSSDDV